MLGTVQLKDKFADLLPEVRTFLLGKLFVHKDLALGDDFCNPQIAGEEYSGDFGEDPNKVYSYHIEIRNGLVDSTYLKLPDQDPVLEQVD